MIWISPAQSRLSAKTLDRRQSYFYPKGGPCENVKARVGVQAGVHVGVFANLQNRFNLSFAMIPLPRVGSLLVRQLAERRRSLVVLDDISRSDNVSEAVTFGDLSALFSFSAHDQHSLVFLNHLSHGSVTTDELCRRHFDVKLAG